MIEKLANMFSRSKCDDETCEQTVVASEENRKAHEALMTALHDKSPLEDLVDTLNGGGI